MSIFADALHYGDGDRWSYVSIVPTSASCTFEPLPPNALPGTCSSNGPLAEDHSCELACETATPGDDALTCRDGAITWPGVCGTASAPPADTTEVRHIWEMACVAVSAVAIGAVASIIREFKRKLKHLPELELPEGEGQVGYLGFVLFILGIWDLIVDFGLCYSLWGCGQWILLACCASTLVLTVVTTIYLSVHTLSQIQRDSPEANEWVLSHRAGVALVIIASASRLDSMATLRLELCGKMMVDFPMGDRYFHFLRNAGMYHYLIEDIPHGMISIALLAMAEGGETTCEHQSVLLAALSLAFASFSIVFGVVSKAVQLLAHMTDSNALRAENAQLREQLLAAQGSE